MNRRLLSLTIVALLALPSVARSAPFTYHGELLDGDAPAEGAYDLRLRSYANPGDVKSLGEATELPGVKLSEGRFSIEVDLPEDVDGTSWVEVAVRKAGSGEDFVALGDPQPLSKVNSTCPGAWALDGNSGAPVGSYLGFADDRAVSVNAPRGVVVNSTAAPASTIDLTVHAKSGGVGDADADLGLVSRSGKFASVFVRDGDGNSVLTSGSGGFEFFDGVPVATQNNGLETVTFSGRLRSRAAGIGTADTSGGIWFDDENPRASFMGRGDNQSNWTGVFTNPGGWRFTAHDNGAFGFNTGTEALAANVFKVNALARINTGNWPGEDSASLALGPAPSISAGNVSKQYFVAKDAMGQFRRAYIQYSLVGASPELSIGVPSLATGEGYVYVDNRVGLQITPTANLLEVGGNASKSTAGAWLANSDRRIKTDIAPIPNALDTIMKLRPVTFRYDDAYRTSHKGIDPKRYYNVIAQEFAEVFPDAVKGSGEYLPGQPKSKDNEILQVDTYPAQITAIAAIQELAVQNDALREQLATLSARLERLERNAKEQ